MDTGEEIPRGFLIARGYGSKVLDDVEEMLDEMALAVERVARQSG